MTFYLQVVVLAIVASALGVPAPEADPQLIVPGATTTLGALPLAGARTIVNAPAVAVQTPVVATPAVRTINTIPAPVAAPLAVPTLLGKSAPCVNDANIPVPCADGVVAPIAPIAPIARTVVNPVIAPLAGARPLVAHPNGAVVPLDEPAVAAARADHLAAKGVLPVAPVAAPVVRAALPAAPVAVNAALPVPAVRTVAQTVVAAPAPIATPAIVRAAPAVVEEAVPVTYTHLGAHPIQPTTVIEGRQRLVL